MNAVHQPVLLEEVAANVVTGETSLYVDATVGGGGHAYEILKRNPAVHLIGIDVDEEALEISRRCLEPFRERVLLVKGNFANVETILRERAVLSIDAILFDLGFSSIQLAGRRGFSFYDEEFLDMRMDKEIPLTAHEVVNDYEEEELRRILRDFGEEYRAPSIVRAILRARQKAPIASARELAAIVTRTKGPKGRIHAATKVFQALRIAVNDELSNLQKGIQGAMHVTRSGGRIGVISFHSLEDRIVKLAFRDEPCLRQMTKKPIAPGREEARANPRARSAKLRVAEKL
jgi:16S rRNA (cytosine1402-N4)-methyltransferase